MTCLTYRTANERSPVTFVIAAEETEYVHISECPVFVVSGSYNGISAKDMWHEVKQVRYLLPNFKSIFLKYFCSLFYFPSCCFVTDKANNYAV